MKTMLFISILSVLTLFSLVAEAQQDCSVLLPNLSGEYAGKCKKGLAHGKGTASGIDKYEGYFSKGLPNGQGTYTWKNGASYKGEWKEGKRNGEGIYTAAAKDTVLNGIWEEDKYVGKKPAEPNVIRSVSVTKYAFRKVSDQSKKINISIFQNGGPNTKIKDFRIFNTSGALSQLFNTYSLSNVQFPITIKINYSCPNAISQAVLMVEFEFEITEPGEWNVKIEN